MLLRRSLFVVLLEVSLKGSKIPSPAKQRACPATQTRVTCAAFDVSFPSFIWGDLNGM